MDTKATASTLPHDSSQLLPDGRPPRLDSVDFLRGLVMVIMALDHVRDYYSDRIFSDPVDLTTTTPGIFLTRWITHYCAPTFIFLAGTGAFLSGTRGKSKAEMSWFLITRGLWLAFLEITVIKFSWAFHWDPIHHGAGVFWPIGWSMVVLAALIHLPTSAIAVFGVVMVCFHNLLDPVKATDLRLPGTDLHLPEWLWMILHRPPDPPAWEYPVFSIGSTNIMFSTGYCLIPWVGVMALGYCFGNLLLLDSNRRRKELIGLGITLTLAFIILRYGNVYGDASRWQYTQDSPWKEQPQQSLYTFFSFLNCTKYPPSLMFLLMTLGPAILVLGLVDRAKGPVVQFFVTFGRVPLFFYLLHIPLIHGSAVLIDYLRFGWSPLATNGPWLGFNPDLAPQPPGSVNFEAVYVIWLNIALSYGFSLPMVYLVWVIIVFLLYPPCRWFAGVKKRYKAAWLSYL